LFIALLGQAIGGYRIFSFYLYNTASAVNIHSVPTNLRLQQALPSLAVFIEMASVTSLLFKMVGARFCCCLLCFTIEGGLAHLIVCCCLRSHAWTVELLLHQTWDEVPACRCALDVVW
jgi:hypothetical protein